MSGPIEGKERKTAVKLRRTCLGQQETPGREMAKAAVRLGEVDPGGPIQIKKRSRKTLKTLRGGRITDNEFARETPVADKEVFEAVGGIAAGKSSRGVDN